MANDTITLTRSSVIRMRDALLWPERTSNQEFTALVRLLDQELVDQTPVVADHPAPPKQVLLSVNGVACHAPGCLNAGSRARHCGCF